MNTQDAAFLWETEALRSRRQTVAPPTVAANPGWVTLRQAHEDTGVPVGTLRKWSRRGLVPSMMVDSGTEMRRLVRLESVVAKARAQGRTIPAPGAPGPTTVAAPPAPATSPDTASPDSAAPAGTMIVPIAAWEKMLLQLGNLHEAGQELAVARERAARAETEASFLRERLAEMRAASEKAARSAPADAAAEEPGTAAQHDTGAAPGEPRTEPALADTSVWEYARRRWQRRRRR